ncbi:serine dehydratase-like [Oscarella lobularis]|uniref:serine dehydratase-like n=1 Tax=Oscarella lobularis TaxID=121494 RepID=UPI00331423E7
MAALHYETPLVESDLASQRAGCKVLLKLENVQNTSVYKIRGIGHRCRKVIQEGCTHLVSSSGGNAGIATAFAGRKLGVPVTVVVPESTPEVMRERIRKEKADVIVHGKVWDDANSKSLELASQPGYAHIHPFDHPDIWEGHASLIYEIKSQLNGAKPGAVIVAVGGGGLLNGIIHGLQAVNWNDVPVIAMETEGADSFAAACKAGKLVTLPDITSIAKCLGAKTVTQKSFDLTKEHPIVSCVVSDKAAVNACDKFLDDHHCLVEPACGAALAAIYEPHFLVDLQEKGRLSSSQNLDNVVCIVCGGNGISIELLLKWKRDLGLS